LDVHALSMQSAQLTRPRNYDDARFTITLRHPRNAPTWTYARQVTPADTDFSAPETPAEPAENIENIVEIEAEEETVVAQSAQH
jgi:hypothetical protein